MATIILDGHPKVSRIHFRAGRFTYQTHGMLSHGPAVPPSKRKDLKYAETKFRYMLRNEAQVSDANLLVDRLLVKMAKEAAQVNGAGCEECGGVYNCRECGEVQ